jgi:hypothetical protein
VVRRSVRTLVCVAEININMRIKIDTSALRETSWYHYGIRFLFGGCITAAAGMIAKQWGPVVGGLFLAFPAIFPASATLVENHEKQKKEKIGAHGTVRGRKAAGVDAAGSTFGSLGLILFGLIVWWLIPYHRPVWVLPVATSVWLIVAVLAWYIHEML